MTRKEISTNKSIIYHHTSMTRGYVSRELGLDELPAIPYSGRFGKGFKVLTPCNKSTQYCFVEYWIEKEE